MRLANASLVVVLALAGCMGTVEDPTSTTRSLPAPVMQPWTPLPCDSGNATQTARNAQLVARLQGTEEAIAREIAKAMGDNVTGPGAHFDDEPSLRWPTQKGYVVVNMGDGFRATPMDPVAGKLFASGAYHRNTGVADAAQVEAFAKALGTDPSTLRTTSGPQGSVRQQWANTTLYWQGYMVAGANWRVDSGGYTVHIGAFYDFLVDRPVLNTTAALASARTFLRCHMDGTGETEAKGYRLNSTTLQGIAVYNGTLTYLVNIHHTTVAFSPCPVQSGQPKWDARWVFVDVVTGAVRHTMRAPCI